MLSLHVAIAQRAGGGLLARAWVAQGALPPAATPRAHPRPSACHAQKQHTGSTSGGTSGYNDTESLEAECGPAAVEKARRHAVHAS